MPKQLQSTIVRIGQSNRVTLPKFLGEQNDEIVFQLWDDHTITCSKKVSSSKDGGPAIKLYGAFIGSRINKEGAEKFWYLIVDQEGNIISRGKSTTLKYVKTDVTKPNAVDREKFTKRCTKWEIPIFVDHTNYYNTPTPVLMTIQDIKWEYKNGNWPPVE